MHASRPGAGLLVACETISGWKNCDKQFGEVPAEVRAGNIVTIAALGVAVRKLGGSLGRFRGPLQEIEEISGAARKWDSVESLLHVVKGNYQKAGDGSHRLVSGMHTKTGFDHFLKMNQDAGKTFGIRNVTEFAAERIEAGGEILSQTLANGVRRLQLPRDAWANGDAFSGANFPVSASRRLKGIKTLWPDSYDVQKIGDITMRIVESNPSVRDGAITTVVDGIRINVRVDAAGKTVTSFPTWNQ